MLVFPLLLLKFITANKLKLKLWNKINAIEHIMEYFVNYILDPFFFEVDIITQWIKLSYFSLDFVF